MKAFKTSENYDDMSIEEVNGLLLIDQTINEIDSKCNEMNMR
jgi:hypothetical protein